MTKHGGGQAGARVVNDVHPGDSGSGAFTEKNTFDVSVNNADVSESLPAFTGVLETSGWSFRRSETRPSSDFPSKVPCT